MCVVMLIRGHLIILQNKRGSQTSWSTLPKHVTGNHDAPPKVAKERRAAAGQEVCVPLGDASSYMVRRALNRAHIGR